MSGTAQSTATVEQRTEANLDQDWVCDLIARWKVAEEFVLFLDPELLPAGHALRRVMAEDVPAMIKELVRLRPDLA